MVVFKVRVCSLVFEDMECSDKKFCISQCFMNSSRLIFWDTFPWHEQTPDPDPIVQRKHMGEFVLWFSQKWPQ